MISTKPHAPLAHYSVREGKDPLLLGFPPTPWECFLQNSVVLTFSESVSGPEGPVWGMERNAGSLEKGRHRAVKSTDAAAAVFGCSVWVSPEFKQLSLP